MREQYVIWRRLFPKRAEEARARRFYAIDKGRASVVMPAGLESLAVQFYPRSDSVDLQEMPYAQLEATHSQDDGRQKSAGVVAFVLLAIILPAILYWPYSPATDHEAQRLAAIALLVLLAAAVIGALAAMAMVQNNFNNMDKAWQGAIRQLLDTDMRTKLEGIRDCMLTFRRFIKWRRFMSYVLILVYAAIAVETVLFLCAVCKGTLPNDKLTVAGFLIAILLLQGLTAARYSYMRWYHTNLRDPSLQLGVMLAEQHRETISALRSRGR